MLQTKTDVLLCSDNELALTWVNNYFGIDNPL